MFKILVLQQLNNLSDDRIEYQIQDRVSFMRFLGLGFADKIPKAGETPSQWKKEENKSMLRQKDVDARWFKKNEEKYYGYKSHINADQTHKLIHAYKVTTASLHDSQVLEELFDHTMRLSQNQPNKL